MHSPQSVELDDRIHSFENVPTETIEATTTFEYLGISGSVLQGVEAAGFVTPSPIQEVAIPTILSGRDLIGQAQTGSGKTGAFVIPALESMAFDHRVEVVVLVPTRELAQQVSGEFQRLGQYHDISVVEVVGGQPAYRQIEMVNRGANVVVATPGRLLDHLSSGRLKRFEPRLVVLDEADEMLDMGFIDDIRSILGFVPKQRQTLLFSATMPAPIARLARDELKDPYHIKLNDANARGHVDIDQYLYVMKDSDKEMALLRLIDAEQPDKALVFCRTRVETEELCQRLIQQGMGARALHGDMSQPERTRAVKDIKSGRINILVATDVASRGLDIDDLSHVFNFHTPQNRDRYTHRIGRTGRAGKKGVAITLATPNEVRENDFYRRKPQLNFKVGAVPSRRDIQSKQDAQLWDQVRQTAISDSARRACEKLMASGHEDPFELVCKFYAYMQSGRTVAGPETVGLSPDDIAKLASRPAAYGGRGRPQQGRRSKGRPAFPKGPRHGQAGRAQEGRGQGGKGQGGRNQGGRSRFDGASKHR